MKPDGISQERWDRGIYWNPWQLVDGCTKVSAGCQNCWSLGMARRYKQDFVEDGEWNGRVRLNYNRLNIPVKEQKPTVYAVWNDLFHKAVKQEYICQVYDAMRDCERHTFLVLTKRIERAVKFRGLPWPDNIWLGTSVSTQEDAEKNIPELLTIPAAVRFLSIEPLLEDIDFAAGYNRRGDTVSMIDEIDLAIVGCESGPKRRPCRIEWVRTVVEQCKTASVAVFVKQLNIDGKVVKDISKFPEDLRLREWPMSGAGKR